VGGGSSIPENIKGQKENRQSKKKPPTSKKSGRSEASGQSTRNTRSSQRRDCSYDPRKKAFAGRKSNIRVGGRELALHKKKADIEDKLLYKGEGSKSGNQNYAFQKHFLQIFEKEGKTTTEERVTGPFLRGKGQAPPSLVEVSRPGEQRGSQGNKKSAEMG